MLNQNDSQEQFQSLQNAYQWANQIILGKEQVVKLAFVCFLAGGHLLLDDRPGMGKTTLAHTLSNALGLSFGRVQFTSDLLPSDVLGVSVFESNHEQFRFHKGPVFTHVFLADEINRASPRTQSALLEAMAEKQVSMDGQTYDLPHPFFVMATQNPVDLAGTFPLPDSQLDRFLFRLSLGYPNPENELRLLREDALRQTDKSVPDFKGLGEKVCLGLRQHVHSITVTDSLLTYLHRLLQSTRSHSQIKVGLSPRAGLALLRAAKAWAFLEGKEHVSPEDVQMVFPYVASHRLVMSLESSMASSEEIVEEILKKVKI